ncbi:MAG: ABC transporter substrate-binding protein [Pseudomonadota bacterium]
MTGPVNVVLRLAAVLSCVLAVSVSVVRAETFELVTGDNYPPFTSTARDNGGLATDIIQAVFREMGHQTNVTFKPWKRGYQDALSGKYVGTFPYAKNDKREEAFNYSDPLYPVNLYFFAAEGTDARYESDEDLRQQRVCVPLGYNPVRLLQLKEAGIVNALIRPQSLENCFQMLAKKRVDLVRVNDMIGWSVIAETFGKRDGFRLIDKPFGSGSPEYLIISKSVDGGEDLIVGFNAAMAKMKSDGRIHKLIERHLN